MYSSLNLTHACKLTCTCCGLKLKVKHQTCMESEIVVRILGFVHPHQSKDLLCVQCAQVSSLLWCNKREHIILGGFSQARWQGETRARVQEDQQHMLPPEHRKCMDQAHSPPLDTTFDIWQLALCVVEVRKAFISFLSKQSTNQFLVPFC